MPNWVRLASGAILLVWLAQLGWQAWALARDSGAGISGADYSAFVSIGGLLLLFGHMALNILRPAMTENGDTPPPARSPDRDLVLRFAAFVAVWLVYVLLLPVAGFVLATFVAMSASMFLLGRPNPVAVLVGCAVFTVTLKVLFITVFYISLPPGFIDEFITELVFDLTS